MRANFLRLCFAAIAAATAPALFAVDGQVLINQATAASGLPGCGLSPGAISRALISICQPGSYKLSGNIVATDPSKFGIEITAAFVTLDLNGFSISCPAVLSCQSSGVHGDSRPLVRNGIVRGFGGGLYLTIVGGENFDGGTVERVVVQDAEIAITAAIIDGVEVRNAGIGVIARKVTNSTIEARGTGIFLSRVGLASQNSVYVDSGIGIDGGGLKESNSIWVQSSTGVGIAGGTFRGNRIRAPIPNQNGLSLGSNDCNGNVC
jgi:hypothetical protein